MRFNLDENLSVHLKPTLISLGHDVMTVADEGLLSKPDTVVADAARSESRILFTLDVEFADLRKYAPGTHPGIVLFRPRSLGATTVNEFVEAFVRQTDLDALTGCVVVVDSARVRVRQP